MLTNVAISCRCLASCIRVVSIEFPGTITLCMLYPSFSQSHHKFSRFLYICHIYPSVSGMPFGCFGNSENKLQGWISFVHVDIVLVVRRNACYEAIANTVECLRHFSRLSRIPHRRKHCPATSQYCKKLVSIFLGFFGYCLISPSCGFLVPLTDLLQCNPKTFVFVTKAAVSAFVTRVLINITPQSSEHLYLPDLS
ncbi:hypothetical protein AHF37_08053 [Paragonimus kellicotti]|nr:hypothetical protein AHF37_08053 [Paragonimus kellicotti]